MRLGKRYISVMPLKNALLLKRFIESRQLKVLKGCYDDILADEKSYRIKGYDFCFDMCLNCRPHSPTSAFSLQQNEEDLYTKTTTNLYNQTLYTTGFLDSEI